MKDKKFSELISGTIKPLGDALCEVRSGIIWNQGWEVKAEELFNSYKKAAYDKLELYFITTPNE